MIEEDLPATTVEKSFWLNSRFNRAGRRVLDAHGRKILKIRKSARGLDQDMDP